MKKIGARELAEKYCSFFKNKGHKQIPSAPIAPEDDASALFISAGMQPLAAYLLGESHPLGKRIVNIQECLRTGDIDEVGDTYHHTWFEMLGHWSLGDYFKVEAIKMTFELLTKIFDLPVSRLAVSVFAGNSSAEKDELSASVWQDLGLPLKRIVYLDDDNWWELPGSSGPCGPCTEVFYWIGTSLAPDKFDPQDERWVEISNDVLMQYEKIGKGKYKMASRKNIDNGTGLERCLAVLNGLSDDYRTDIFRLIIEAIEEVSGKQYGKDKAITRAMRIIADHLRSAVFVLASGVMPSNKEQGYVLRRLIRRAIRQGRLLGIEKDFTKDVGLAVIENQNNYGGVYPHLDKNKQTILQALLEEEIKFRNTLERGLKKFLELVKENNLTGLNAFDLRQSYGFPLELTIEEAKRIGYKLLSNFKSQFREAEEAHQELSRTAAKGKFKGGLSGHSTKVVSYHTTTHLLQSALKKVLGDHVTQTGSNITEQRLRFDFTHPEKLTTKEVKAVEDLVNQVIKSNLVVKTEAMSFDKARAKGALFVVGKNYPNKVKVYSIGDFSFEICGGPHIDNTSQLGEFKITKQDSSGAGKRRLYGMLN